MSEENDSNINNNNITNNKNDNEEIEINKPSLYIKKYTLNK